MPESPATLSIALVPLDVTNPPPSGLADETVEVSGYDAERFIPAATQAYRDAGHPLALPQVLERIAAELVAGRAVTITSTLPYDEVPSPEVPSIRESDHPYYATEGCFYVGGAKYHEVHTDHATWPDFIADMGDADLDYNLLYRWDWKKPEPDEDGDPTPPERLELFYMQQRKAKPASHFVTITAADEPAARAWLAVRAEHLRAVWAPLLG